MREGFDFEGWTKKTRLFCFKFLSNSRHIYCTLRSLEITLCSVEAFLLIKRETNLYRASRITIEEDLSFLEMDKDSKIAILGCGNIVSGVCDCYLNSQLSCCLFFLSFSWL